MISTRICPSPLLLKLSATATDLGHNGWARAGFCTRTDFCCKLSLRHENFNFPKKIITTTTTQKRIWGVKNKPSEVEGVVAAAYTGEDEEEGLREEDEEEKEEGCLSEEEKKKICEFVEGLSEERKQRIFQILTGLSEEEKRKLSGISEQWRIEEYEKICALVEGFSEEGKSKIRSIMDDLSEQDKRKMNKLLKRMDKEHKKNMTRLVDCLSEQGLKRVINKFLVEQHREEGGEGKNSIIECLLIVMEDLSKKDSNRIVNLACILNEEIEAMGVDEDKKRKINKFVEELCGEYQNKKTKESVKGSRDEKVKIKEFLRSCYGFSDEDMQPLMNLVNEMSEDYKREIRVFLEDLQGVNKISKVVDLINGFKEMDYKKLLHKASLKLSPRLKYISNVFSFLRIHFSLGIVAYAAMKTFPSFTDVCKQNYFNMFTLPLTSVFLLPACQFYKDKFSVKDDVAITDSILFGAVIAAFGALLAYLHIANSNGMIMLAGLILTLAVFVLISLSAVFEVVIKDGDLSCFAPPKSSIFMAIATLVGFLLVFIGGPVIDAGLGVLGFTMFVLYDVGKILKGSDKEVCQAASAHIFWDLFGLFISSIKLLAVIFCPSISSA